MRQHDLYSQHMTLEHEETRAHEGNHRSEHEGAGGVIKQG